MEIQITDSVWPKTLFEESEPRKEGLHLGTVIKSLQDKAGLGYTGKGFADMQLTAEIGVVWELVLSRVMREKYALRPPQLKLDGIWLSPDGVSFDDPVGTLSIGPDPAGKAEFVVEEYKLTWRSTKHGLDDNFYYMCQIKAYCYALQTNVAVMRIFYVNGNYKGSGPQYKIVRIRFTDRELQDNWKMILKHKEKYFD